MAEKNGIAATIIKCPRCGFPCRVGREVAAERGSSIGDGITYQRISGISAEKYDPVVEAGCPMCGYMMWNEGDASLSDEDKE